MRYFFSIIRHGRDLVLLYLFFALISTLPHINLNKVELSNSLNLFLINVKTYTINLFQGSFGTYTKGRVESDLLSDILIFAWRSFEMLFISLLIATFFSIAIGIYLSIYRKNDKLINGFLTILNSIPDFILILLLQLIAVTINLKFEKSVFRIVSYGDNQAFLLPVLTLIIIPLVYFIKEIDNHISVIITEEYIRTALSKGLTKWNVVSRHVFTNLIPYLKADLIKVISISIGNLFIIEYLYSSKGLTYFMLSYTQFQVWMTSFLFLTLIFIALYLSLQLFLILLRRWIVGE